MSRKLTEENQSEIFNSIVGRFRLASNSSLVGDALFDMLNSNLDPKGKYRQAILGKKPKRRKFQFVAVKETRADALTRQPLKVGKRGLLADSVRYISKKTNISMRDIYRASRNPEFKPNGFTILRFDDKGKAQSFQQNYLKNKFRNNRKLKSLGIYDETGSRKNNIGLQEKSSFMNNNFGVRVKKYELAIPSGQRLNVFSLSRLIHLALERTNMGKGDKINLALYAGGKQVGSTGYMTIDKLLDQDLLSETGVVLTGTDGTEFSFDNDDVYEGINNLVIYVAKNPQGGTFVKSKAGSKKSIITIKNDDELCLGRCIVVAQAIKCNHPMLKQIKMGRKIQTQLTHQLYDLYGIPKEIATLETIYDFEEALDCSITIIDGDAFNNVIHPDTDDYEPKEFNIYLYKTGNHYDLINNTKVAGFFQKNYFCHSCKETYSSKNKHKCNFKCNICCMSDCDSKNIKNFKDCSWIECPDCDRKFPTQKCFDNHKISSCATIWKCKKCRKCMSRKEFPKETHICGEYKCPMCKCKVQKDHKCYMLPQKPNDFNENIICFDFEATQDKGEHIVNLAVSKCMGNDIPIIHKNIDEFCNWAFDSQNKGATFIAHNGKGFINTQHSNHL